MNPTETLIDHDHQEDPVTLELETPQPGFVDRAEWGHALRAATRRIAPVWPLDRFVAVNPYLGLSDQRFADAAHRLALTGGARSTLPTGFYLEAVSEGRIIEQDLRVALGALESTRPIAVNELLARFDDDRYLAADRPIRTVADAAGGATGLDWAALVVDRVSAWAAAYFDADQAMWRSAEQSEPLFLSWKFEAGIDRTPEVMGLAGFRAFVQSLPDDPSEAAREALEELAVPERSLELYLHRLLMTVGGWSALVARLAFESDLEGSEDDAPIQLLAVLLCWEQGLLRWMAAQGFDGAWEDAKTETEHLITAGPSQSLAHRIVLQDAFDHSEQRGLAERLARNDPQRKPVDRPRIQAIFCIDVRSEVFRRHFERLDPEVETLGFAGFFGFPIAWRPIGLDVASAQCPVLLTPSHVVPETLREGSSDRAAAARRLSRHVRRAWKTFKMGAVSCFSFVGPVGLAYLPKLFTDGWGRSRPVPHPERDGLPAWALDGVPDLSTIPGADRVDLAEGALRAMSLTHGFAPLVLICGHGATTVNNPYDSGLACGACGGHSGETNARVAAAVLNDPAVREGLALRGIEIPADTRFVPALHDTTTDEVTLLDTELASDTNHHLLRDATDLLADASSRARAERALRLGIDLDEDVERMVLHRSRDWAQVRPEWGLAGCRSFIVAPRHRTEGLDLEGRSFLHSYEWREDEGFGVLELIMTAPMVVASWINLQYFGSTVDNELFGSGNKTLHNVVGRMGVFEGTAGDLRTGLPWQSVHDGERYQHEPIRLSVVIEAPTHAMSDVLAAHPEVRQLCDNGWVHLHAMGDDGRISHRYAGDLNWEPVT